MVGSTILTFFFVSLSISAATFAIGRTLTYWHVIVSVILSFISCLLLSRHYFKRYILYFGLIIFIITAVVYASWFLAKHFVDLSYDGQAYQQTAIIKLSEGWNPFYKQLSRDELGTLALWVNHYPKAMWIYSTGIYQLVGDIEQAKVFSPLLLFAAWCIVFSFLLEIQPRRWIISLLVSCVAVFNPVTIY